MEKWKCKFQNMTNRKKHGEYNNRSVTEKTIRNKWSNQKAREFCRKSKANRKRSGKVIEIKY